MLTPAVLFGISNSGAVSRTIEAVAMARDAGLDTIAVTGHGASSITQEAAATVAIPSLLWGVHQVFAPIPYNC